MSFAKQIAESWRDWYIWHTSRGAATYPVSWGPSRDQKWTSWPEWQGGLGKRQIGWSWGVERQDYNPAAQPWSFSNKQLDVLQCSCVTLTQSDCLFTYLEFPAKPTLPNVNVRSSTLWEIYPPAYSMSYNTVPTHMALMCRGYSIAQLFLRISIIVSLLTRKVLRNRMDNSILKLL